MSYILENIGQIRKKQHNKSPSKITYSFGCAERFKLPIDNM